MQDMLHYIEAEPKIYADILANRQTILRALLNDKSTAYKNVVIFATGSSSNAAFAAQPYMSQQLGIPVFVEEPSFTANYMLHLQRIRYISPFLRVGIVTQRLRWSNGFKQSTAGFIPSLVTKTVRLPS